MITFAFLPRPAGFAVWILPIYLVAGCQTSYEDAGQGPITLSNAAAAGYQKYLNFDYPTAFAVSTDGKNYSFRYCEGISCLGNPEGDSVRSCSELVSGRGITCRLFAVGRDIVWNGTGFYAGQEADEYPFMISVFNHRKILTENYSGTAKMSAGGDRLDLSITFRRRACRGTADTRTFQWTLACGDQPVIDGTFIKSDDELYLGLARTRKDETFEFAVHNKPTITNGIALPPGSWRPRGGAPANLSAPALCARALNPDRENAWSTESPSAAFVKEAKRREFSPRVCEKHVADDADVTDNDATYIVCLLPDGIHRYIKRRHCRQRNGREKS